MTAMARPNPSGREAEPDSVEDDPLVELARIVAGRSARPEPRRRNVFQETPGISEADLARDLEAELLSDLQATFAAAGADEDEPPLYSAEDIAAEQRPPQFDAATDAAENPLTRDRDERDQDEHDVGRLDYAQENSESGQVVAEPEWGWTEPEGVPFDPPNIEEPAAGYEDEFDVGLEADPQSTGSETTFPGMGLRDSRSGPAFNPAALDAEGPPTPVVVQSGFQTASEVRADDPGPAAAAPSYQSSERDVLHSQQLVDPTYEQSLAADLLEDREAWDELPPAPSPQFVRHRDPRLVSDPLGEARRASRRGGRTFYSIAGVLGLVAIGIAAVLVLRGGGSTETDPPLIAADASPVRVFPEPVANADEAGNVVFDRVNPGGNEAPNENLLAGAEPVADLAATPEANDGITQILTPVGPADPAAADFSVPRMVRTVLVNADGELIESQATPADGVIEPGVPAIPDGDIQADPVAVAPPAQEPQVLVPIDPAPVQVAAAPGEIRLPSAGDPIAPGFYVQVSAQGTELAAQSQLQELHARAPSVLGSRPSVIQRAELPQGVFYRVQFGPVPSEAAANQFRQQLLAIGIDAFVTTN